MTLTPGTRIGSYEIAAPIGAGGMGEVYRARDTKLDRDVALKILPEAFASDPDRLARFEREAKTLAALNHPNIAHVYDAGRHGATAYLAMELVEGEDLSELIKRRSPEAERVSARLSGLPLADAIAIAKQVVDALEAAHENGIIHRDLKPANIKVRDDGTVKVLDFGLAKALAGPEGPASMDALANSPTLSARATQMGVVLGTAAYMAPEQARGKAVDRRADIWAFGVVLYEMLTGKRAFEGEDISVTLANVIKEEARWDALRADVPAPVRRLLRRCLEKDPKRRLSAIGDARLELDEKEEGGHGGDGGRGAERAEVRGGSTLLSRLWPALAGAALVAIVWYATSSPRAPQAGVPGYEFVVETADGPVFQIAPKISPDGRLVAWVAPASGSNGIGVIWVRQLDVLEPRQLAGTSGASGLFWSTQSDAIGYFQSGGLFRASLGGGTPQRLCEIHDFAGASFMQGGDVIVGSFDGQKGKLFRVPAQGGIPVELPRPKAAATALSYVYPEMLRDDRHFVYVDWAIDGASRALYVGSIDGDEPVKLVSSEGNPVVAPGHLLFLQSGVLFAQPFDEASRTLSGTPVRLADGILMHPYGYAAFSVSRTGVLAYRKGESFSEVGELAWVDRSGKATGTIGETLGFRQVRVSPDGRKVVYEAANGQSDSSRLWVLDLANGVSSPLTPDKATALNPVWSPTSDSIAFVAYGKENVIQLQQIGSGSAVISVQPEGRTQWLSDWSSDGKHLLFHAGNKLFTATPGDPKSVKLVLDAPGPIDGAHISPDGKWVAYLIEESQNAMEVWVASFPEFTQRRQVSPKGGGEAQWRGDGKELFYMSPGGKLMAVRLAQAAGGTLDVSAPVELFQSPITRPRLDLDEYWPTKDGQRFLFIRPKQAATAKVQPITVVVNWMKQLTAGTK
ncbi:MAG TPA: protein kinase [Vicinamibacterales bacterium]|nr:protein kinase [Vicinamibacterales bacterium]